MFNGVTIYDYACTSELRGNSGSTIAGIGTFVHEFGHVIGLPDYYHTTDSRNKDALEFWSVMDRGSYCNNSRTPPLLSAYDRFYLGWHTPEQYISGQKTLYPLSQSGTAAAAGQAYLLSATNHNLNGKNPNPSEFFVMEYREKTGWDAYIGNNSTSGMGGMLFWHIDYSASAWSSNTVNNYTGTIQTQSSHMRVYLEPTDGLSQTTPGGAFTSGSFTPKLWNGSTTGLPVITNITKNGSASMTFGETPPEPCTPISTFPFTETFEATSTTLDCWTQQNVSGLHNWGFGTTSNVTANFTYAYFFYGARDNQTTKLISPVLQFNSTNLYKLSFDMVNRNWSGDINKLKVYYRTSATSAWVELASYLTANESWVTRNIDLPNTSATYQIAFEGINSWGYPLAIGNVQITSNAPVPKVPTAFSVTPDENGVLSAVLQWTNPTQNTANEVVTLTKVEVKRDGVLIYTDNAPVAGAVATYTDNLPSDGTYAYAVYAYDVEGASAPATQTVYVGTDPCAITDFPWIERFESTSTTLACWTQDRVVFVTDWLFGTGISYIPANNSTYAYFHNTNSFAAVTKLITPVLQLSSSDTYKLSFDMTNPSRSGYVNQLKIYYRTNAVSDWVLIEGYTTAHEDWATKTIELPNTSATYQIAFEGLKGINGISDYGRPLAIDNVKVYSCYEVMDYTIISHDAYGDGWGGAQLIIKQNGEVVATIANENLDGNPNNSATGGEYNTHIVLLCSCEPIEAVWVKGGILDYECSFVIKDNRDVVIFETPAGTTSFSTTAGCAGYDDNEVVFSQTTNCVPAQPKAPTELSVIPDQDGVLSVALQWRNPTETTSGEETTLTKVEVKRNGLVIYTDNAAVAGAVATYTDNSPTYGTHIYTVFAYNDAGASFPAADTVFVGTDPCAITIFPFTETFASNSTTRACWTQKREVGSASWQFSTSSSNSANFSGATDATTKLITPVLKLNSSQAYKVIFDMLNRDAGIGNTLINHLKVYYRTNEFSKWVLLQETAPSDNWVTKTITLPNTSETYQIAFEGVGRSSGGTLYIRNVIVETGANPCDDPVLTFPWVETFASNSATRDCWTQRRYEGISDWQFRSSNGAYFVARTNSATTTDGRAGLVSPTLQLNPSDSYKLSFDMINRPSSSNNINCYNLRVYYRTSPTSSRVLLRTYTTVNDSWVTKMNIDLPNPSSTYKIEFEGSHSYNAENISINNIKVELVPACPAPTGLTATGAYNSLNIDFASTASAWQYCIGTTSDSSPNAANAVDFNTKPYTISSGLLPDSTYRIWVRANCGDNSYSAWSGYATFPQIIRYVTPEGTGDGTSWANASANIQNMIDEVGFSGQVWIATGNYNLTATLQMREGVNVYGGFLGNETSTEQRQRSDLNGNGIVEQWEFIRATVLNGQNTRQVLNQAANFTYETVWDGVTITGGRATSTPNGGGACIMINGKLINCIISNNAANSSSSSNRANGGGIYNMGGTISFCKISSNSVSSNPRSFGGGVYNLGIISNCEVSGNTSGYHGGGIYNNSGTVIYCTVNGNNASEGGGIYNNYGTISHCTISTNTSSSGGGIYSESGTINHCTISSNIASSSSGGEGGGIYSSSLASSHCIVNDCIIEGNIARKGSSTFDSSCEGGGGRYGIYNRCIIRNNRAGSGSALYFGTAENCLIVKNVVSAAGGVSLYRSKLTNSTIVENTGGFAIIGTSGSNGAATATNCIIWGNNGGGSQIGSYTTVTYSAIQGGSTGTGNINLAANNDNGGAMFVNPATENYQLKPCSPCVNRGINGAVTDPATATDLLGNPRVWQYSNSGRVDMGAYEVQEICFVLPKVVTNAATLVTQTTTTLNKNVTAGTETIIEEGFKYKKTSESDWQTSTDGNLTNLTPSTEYQFFAYTTTALHPMTTGDTLTFKTLCENMVNYTIVSHDAWGDGWNGNAALLVRQNGVVVATVKNQNLDGISDNRSTGGEYNTHIVSLCVCEPFELIWIKGTYDYECSFVVRDNNNVQIFATPAASASSSSTAGCAPYTNNQVVYSGTVNCINVDTTPNVTTNAATEITQTTAKLNKTVTEGTEPIIEQGFKYKRTSESTWHTSLDGNLTNLMQNTDYQFHAYAFTATVSVSGMSRTFSTLAHVAPTVVTNPATAIAQTIATLNKTVTAGTETITVQGFKYKKTSESNWQTSTTGNLTGLSTNTQYEFYAYATTATDTYNGSTLNFTTLVHVAPTVVTNAATAITQTTATLNKTVTAGTENIISEGFKYKKTSESNWETSATGNLTNLTPNTQYQFYAYTTTATYPSTDGATLTLTTLLQVAPTVVTNPATLITQTSATLNKSVTQGTETVTTQGFKYKKASESDWQTSVDGILTNLTPNTQYQFFAYAATTTYPSTNGVTLTFTTQCETRYGNFETTVCEGETFSYHDEDYSGGTHQVTLTSSSGCDSIVTLTINVTSANLSVTLENNVLTATQAGAEYQWCMCDFTQNIPIMNATEQSFTPTENGGYSVKIIYENCEFYSQCQWVALSGIDEVLEGSISIYPNPVKNELFITSENKIEKIEICDLAGRTVETEVPLTAGKNYPSIQEGVATINVSDLPQGVYLVKIHTNKGVVTKRVIKN